MATQTHEYLATVDWTGGREGKGHAILPGSGLEHDIAVPKEFDGPGGGSNPEELLTSAITACYAMTYGIIAANRKLDVVEIHVEASGIVEQNGPSFKYKSVMLRPRVKLAAGSTPEQLSLASDMAHKADLYCIITNAVRGNVEVQVEPLIQLE